MSVSDLNNWHDEFSDKINFVVVYIAEAHANDVWPLGNHVSLNGAPLSSHKNFEERVKASDLLTGKYGCKIPLLFDGMDDTFDAEFAVWPERYFVVKDGVMKYIWLPSIEFGFDRIEMKNILESIYKDPSMDSFVPPQLQYS